MHPASVWPAVGPAVRVAAEAGLAILARVAVLAGVALLAGRHAQIEQADGAVGAARVAADVGGVLAAAAVGQADAVAGLGVAAGVGLHDPAAVAVAVPALAVASRVDAARRRRAAAAEAGVAAGRRVAAPARRDQNRGDREDDREANEARVEATRRTQSHHDAMLAAARAAPSRAASDRAPRVSERRPRATRAGLLRAAVGGDRRRETQRRRGRGARSRSRRCGARR